MPDPDPRVEQPDQPRWNAIGCALLAIGLLILIPSGLCTAMLLPQALSGRDTFLFSHTDFYIVAAIAAVGAALVFAAFKVRSRGTRG
jgi:hypothetical protein